MSPSDLLMIPAGFLALLAVLAMFVRFIPNDRIGIVEKRWAAKGSIAKGIIALKAEAGFQPQVLRGGLHLMNVFQYRIHTSPLVTITQGRIGYVFARDGRDLDPAQTLASNIEAVDFQDVTVFLASNGQRGPQRQILREGTYAINLAQFAVITQEKVFYLPLNRDEEAVFRRMADVIGERGGFSPVVIKGADDAIGIVTVHDGPSLPQGEIIAPVVGEDPNEVGSYHNNFQDPEKFLRAGGLRGRQFHVLVEGTYYINRLFATVEMLPKTVIEVGHVGVVVSYTGKDSPDLSGDDYKHGELVAKGCRGVWNEPLLPGKYAFNTYAAKVVSVPTTNIILKWNKSESGAHRYDENLSEVALITKDAFEPSLPLSVVVHIDYRKAPLVIQRFGDVKRLVEQTLDPMVSAYFKNIGQTRTLIQLIQERADIQSKSSEEMKAKFAHYNLELEEVLIGTPGSSVGDKHIEMILTQLRSRQIAEEQVETYSRQEKAAVKERELREAEARARAQQLLTQSEIEISVQSNNGKAEYQRAVQQAAQIRTLAEAEADKIKVVAEADAEKAARVGIGEAIAIEEQVRAYGGPKFQLTQQVMSKFAAAIQQSGVDVVPRVVIGQNGPGGSGGNVMEGLLAMLLSERFGGDIAGEKVAASPEVEALKQQVRANVLKSAPRST
jgi:uncharacterized membrane protein YqiK